jgi:hypothetical protein
MRKRLTTVAFWFCLVGVWVNINLMWALGAIPVLRPASKIFAFSAAIFGLGAVCNYIESRRQS